MGDHHPRLGYEDYNCLHYRIEKGSQHLRLQYLPSQDPQNLLPLIPGLPQVEQNFQPVIICGSYDASQVLKGRQIGDWAAIVPAGPLHDCPGILHYQPEPLPLLSFLSLIGVGVVDI